MVEESQKDGATTQQTSYQKYRFRSSDAYQDKRSPSRTHSRSSQGYGRIEHVETRRRSYEAYDRARETRDTGIATY